MSSGSRKRRSAVDPSTVENEKVKVRKEDEQLLREADKFNSVDDVISEFRSFEGYVDPAKRGDFKKTIEKLYKSDTLLGKKPMSHEEFQRRFGKLRSPELIRIILTKPELEQFAYAALKSKGYRSLDCVVVAADKATLAVKRQDRMSKVTWAKDQIVLDQGLNYGYQLVLLIRIVLKVYDCTYCDFHFKALDFGSSLPFERSFQLNEEKFAIRELRMNNSELAPLLRYIKPEKLYVSFPSANLFDKDGKLMVPKLKYLELSSAEVDKVDKLMETCKVEHVRLARNSHWSDQSVSFVFMEWVFPEFIQVIDCHYEKRNVKPHQKNITQWKKLIDGVFALYKRKFRNRNDFVNIEKGNEIVTFSR